MKKENKKTDLEGRMKVEKKERKKEGKKGKREIRARKRSMKAKYSLLILVTKKKIVAKALDGQRYPLPLCEFMWV